MYAAAAPTGTVITARVWDHVHNKIEEAIYVIGVDSDEWASTFGSGFSASDKTRTSARKMIDVGVQLVISEFLGGGGAAAPCK